MTEYREINFDGLIGPTHNFAGLSFGNVASARHQNQTSSPRRAALQGLAKMKTLAGLGVGQAILPPLFRPDLKFLQQLGFRGTPHQLIQQAAAHRPLLATCYSASSMWTANAATVSPSSDCRDGRLHLTPANLSGTLHRSIEYSATRRNLAAIFSAADHFVVHPALPQSTGLGDEGAANHTRLHPGDDDGPAGLHLFVYGVDHLDRSKAAPQNFPARQTRLASEAIARHHQLDTATTFFWQQSPAAIDAGVFHNDVIAVGHQNVLLCHEQAFVDQVNNLQRLSQAFERRFDQPLYIVQVSSSELTLADAVGSYLFNSQLVTRPDGGMTIICPVECQQNQAAHACLQRLLAEPNPVDQSLFLDLRQSMNNGGGPACLRLRVPMNEAEAGAIAPGVLFDQDRYQQLVAWVEKHYRDELSPADLQDPLLMAEVRSAFESLSRILGLPIADLLNQ